MKSLVRDAKEWSVLTEFQAHMSPCSELLEPTGYYTVFSGACPDAQDINHRVFDRFGAKHTQMAKSGMHYLPYWAMMIRVSENTSL
jgi:hypothetical protein